MKDEGVVQVLLMRGRGTKGEEATVCWIPAQFARKGSLVDVRDRSMGRDTWSLGWYVDHVYSGVRLSSDYVREHERDHRHQREASDI